MRRKRPFSASSVRFLTGRLLASSSRISGVPTTAVGGQGVQCQSSGLSGRAAPRRSPRAREAPGCARRRRGFKARPTSSDAQGDLLAKPEACKRSVERGHRAASSLGPWGHGQITRYMGRRALARLRGRIGCKRRLGRPRPEHYNTRRCDERSSSPLQSW
jgi:hypothetical protein